MENLKTIQDVANEITASNGTPSRFEIDGTQYCMYVESPTVEQSNKWAAFEAEKNRLICKQNEDAQKDAAIHNFKNKARLDALKFAPTRKADQMSRMSFELTASEISQEADIIYEWLVKGI